MKAMKDMRDEQEAKEIAGEKRRREEENILERTNKTHHAGNVIKMSKIIKKEQNVRCAVSGTTLDVCTKISREEYRLLQNGKVFSFFCRGCKKIRIMKKIKTKGTSCKKK